MYSKTSIKSSEQTGRRTNARNVSYTSNTTYEKHTISTLVDQTLLTSCIPTSVRVVNLFCGHLNAKLLYFPYLVFLVWSVNVFNVLNFSWSWPRWYYESVRRPSSSLTLLWNFVLFFAFFFLVVTCVEVSKQNKIYHTLFSGVIKQAPSPWLP